MLAHEIISQYLKQIEEGIKTDASQKNQKIPVKSFRAETIMFQGKLYAADYFKYLVTGRGPGKAPPPDKMLAFVQANPEILERARKVFNNISEKSLAYLIGRKIAKHGTDIHQGRKPGIDLKGAIEGPKEEFLNLIAYHQALEVASEIREAAKV